MAWGAILSSVVQAIPAITQMVKGGEQAQRGYAGLATSKRPEYYDSISRLAYGDPTMPGQTTMMDTNSLIAANSFERAKEGGNPMALIPSILAQEQKGAREIEMASARQQLRDRAMFQKSLATEFQMNQFAPYMEKMQESRDLIGAGEKNQFSGISNLSSIGSVLLSNANFQPNDQSTYDADLAAKSGMGYKSKYLGTAPKASSGSATSTTSSSSNYTPSYQDLLDARNTMFSMYQTE